MDVAPVHASIEGGPGGFTLRAMTPSLPVQVNGATVLEARLRAGDRITIGDQVLTLRTGEALEGVRARRRLFDNADQIIDAVAGKAQRGAEKHLAVLYRVADLVGSTDDVDELARGIIDIVMDASPADRAILLLAADDGRIVPRAGKDRRLGPMQKFPPTSESIIGEVVGRAEGLLCVDVGADDRFARKSSVLDLQLRSVIAVPLVMGGKVRGVLQVDSTGHVAPLDETDLEMLAGVAHQVSVAFERLRLARRSRETDRIRREIQRATEVQRFLLPKEMPEVPGIQIAAVCHPAHGLGGDYYDAIPLGASRLALVVADVSGHDVGSALVMALFRTLVRSTLAAEGDLRRVAEGVEATMQRDSPGGTYVTAFLAHLERHGGSLRYVCAGHPPPLVLGRGGSLRALEPTGPPFGFVPGLRHEVREATLEAGDTLVAYTDGATECRDEKGEPLGGERFRDLVRRMGPEPVDRLVAGVYGAVKAFRGERPADDDLSLLVARSDPDLVEEAFEVPASDSEVAPAVERLAGLLGGRGFKVDAVMRQRIALREALTNAVRHGCRGDPTRLVRVRLEADTGRAQVRVADDGEGFAVRRVERRSLDRVPRSATGGRGVAMMRLYADRVAYNERGNEVTLFFHMGGAAASAPLTSGPAGPGPAARPDRAVGDLRS